MMRDWILQAYNLLASSGSIWVHIDDHEAHRVRLVLDELFGSQNFLGNLIWERAANPKMDSQFFSRAHDHIIVYRKTDQTEFNLIQSPDDDTDYETDEEGPFYWGGLRMTGNRKTSYRVHSPDYYYGMEAPDGSIIFPMRPDGEDGPGGGRKTGILRTKIRSSGLMGSKAGIQIGRYGNRKNVHLKPFGLRKKSGITTELQGKAEISSPRESFPPLNRKLC